MRITYFKIPCDIHKLVYLERHPKGFIHAIYGGSELLMYDVEKVIINLDLEVRVLLFS